MPKSLSPTERLLCDLIAIPSVNPAYLNAGDKRAGESRVADYLEAVARRDGLDTSRQPVLPGRENLIIRLTPAGRCKRRILLAPHMDTVGEPTMPRRLFSPRLASGRIYGRGACDTKGSIAAMLAAVLELSRAGLRPANTEIVLLALVDEEKNQSGSRAFAHGGLKADLAIIGEPTALKVVTAHKGNVWLRLTTCGKAAHGSNPELGQNAIREMARVVELLEGAYARQLRQREHPVLGRATVNVGVIHGGSQPNIVPDTCSIEIDRRTIPGETYAGVVRELQSLMRNEGLRLSIVDGKEGRHCFPLETDSRISLVQSFLRTASQTTPFGVNYFTDASVLAHAGIPSVVFGPGNIAQAHTTDEWISRRSLYQAVTLFARFFQSLPL